MIDLEINLEEYILNHCDPESEILYELNRQTNLKMLYPRILSGHLQGRVLAMMSKNCHSMLASLSNSLTI